MSGTDWAWCFENPKDAAAEIDRLQRETEELRESMSKVIGMLKNRGGFVGRYCLKAKSGIVFVMQAPSTVVTVFKIGEVVELSENELRQNLEINSLEQRLVASEAELKQALQILARLQGENTELKEQLEIEKYRIEILQDENMDLRDEKQNLDDQIADLVHERENG